MSMHARRRSGWCTALLTAGLTALSLWTGPSLAADRPSDVAQQLQAQAGFHGGFVVHLGCGTGELTAALRTNPAVQVHGLDRDPANVSAARDVITAAGVYGPVSVDRLNGNRLPYVDNLVNLLIAEDLGGVAIEDVH